MEYVIVTGMSGAGKSTALKIMEDIGYFCVDNFPIPLLEKFTEFADSGETQFQRIAFGMDIRNGEALQQLSGIIQNLRARGNCVQILFMDASDEVLVKRYKETRRSHPLAADGRVLDGITLERELLSPLKNISQNVVDTTELTPRNLRKTIA